MTERCSSDVPGIPSVNRVGPTKEMRGLTNQVGYRQQDSPDLPIGHRSRTVESLHSSLDLAKRHCPPFASTRTRRSCKPSALPLGQHIRAPTLRRSGALVDHLRPSFLVSMVRSGLHRGFRRVPWAKRRRVTVLAGRIQTTFLHPLFQKERV
jgi:hypothetical protein